MTQEDVSVDREKLSALVDGQLQGADFARTVEWLADSGDARASWHAYHLVGDVLRSGAQAAAGAPDAAFMARLRQRLAEEGPAPPPAMIVRPSAADERAARELDVVGAIKESANAAGFRWKLAAGFASLAALGVIGGQVVLGFGTTESAPQLARLAAPAPLPQADADAQPPTMIRDPRLDQLLAAHQQFGGTSALQMPAGFLRNATYEKPAR